MADLTHGTDDYQKVNIQTLASNASSLQAALDVNVTSKGSSYSYAAGYMFLHYMTKQLEVPFTSGADYYRNNTTSTVLSALGGDDSVINYASNVTIYGNKGNDFLSNQDSLSSGVKVYGGAGHDTLYNWGSDVTLSGGADSDTLANDYRGKNVSISGGKGNDAIQNFANYATICGGKGNDSISLGSPSQYDLIKYASGDGKDTVYGFNSDDTLRITKGKYNVSTKNNDVIVKVGSGSITLKDATGKEISITNSKGKTTTKIYGSASSNVAALWTEDNFSMEDALSSIIQNDSAVSADKIEPQYFDSLTQKNNLITFADK